VSRSEDAGLPVVGSAFLLTQLGTHAAQAFAARIGELDLTPPQTGLLRAVAVEEGRSQQALAQHLGTPATRLVALVDGLEQRGLLERRRNPDDRRLHAVHLTEAGRALLAGACTPGTGRCHPRRHAGAGEGRGRHLADGRDVRGRHGRSHDRRRQGVDGQASRRSRSRTGMTREVFSS
jgi:DNA-binding MarR family transcriptional regulator